MSKAPLIVLAIFCLSSVKSSQDEALSEFQKGFMAKRAAMLSVIKDLTAMDEDKRAKTLDSLLKSMFKVLGEVKLHLESAGMALKDLPEDKKGREYVALLLENTCFFSDILLRFPDYTSIALSKSIEYNTLYRWSLNFISYGDFPTSLINAPTKKLLHLATQELGVGERDPDYVNPYKKEKPPVKLFEDPPIAPKKGKKKVKRGPRLNVEL